MPNDTLRRALAEAKMSERQLAQRIGVDPKTVSRWVVDEHRTPQARLRWRVAEELGRDEVDLWPQAVRAMIKTGPDREIVGVYPYGTAPPDILQRIVASAERDLVFVGYTGYRLWLNIPTFNDLLRAKASGGVRCRFVLGDPDAEITRLTDEVEATPLTVAARIGHSLRQLEPLADAVEVRQSALTWGKGGQRGDNEAMIGFASLGKMGAQGTALHLRRHQDRGIFDQWVEHSEALWEAARPVWD